jgi:transposase InsO family protein
MGINKTWEKIKNKFYWMGHKRDILNWCRECPPGQLHKHDKRRQKAPLVQDPSGSPMHRIALDFVGPLPTTKRGNTVMLVVVDYFTKWGEAFALPDQTAQTTADCLVENFFSRFGLPERIHSDQGSNFESTLFKEMTELMGIKKTRTTPYMPRSDGLCEKLNSTIKQILKGMISENPTEWDNHLQYAMMAYRATPQCSTGYSPNQMMLGREVLLPLDLMYGLPPGESETHSCPTAYTEWLRETLRRAHQQAVKNNEQALKSQKRYYDRGKKEMNLEPGVWVYWKVEVSRGKFEPSFDGPWCVTERLNDVNYRISPCDNGPSKVVHIDKLKVCNGKHPADFVVPHQKETPTQTELLVIPGETLPVPAYKGDQERTIGVKEKLKRSRAKSTNPETFQEKSGKRNRKTGKSRRRNRKNHGKSDATRTPNLSAHTGPKGTSPQSTLNQDTDINPNLDPDQTPSSIVNFDQEPQVITRAGRKIKAPTRFAYGVENFENSVLVEIPELLSRLDILVRMLANPSNDELRTLVKERMDTMPCQEAERCTAWINDLTPMLIAMWEPGIE